MGRVHLVGEAQAGLSGGRRRGLRDLAIAVGLGALVWTADAATGSRLASAASAAAARLALWFEDRRQPVVTCEPGRPRAYTAVGGVVLRVPECWEVEVVPLLDREVHRFHDPEARAGTLSVSVEPIGGEEDRAGLLAELERMASLPGARVDGMKREETKPHEGWAPSVPDSLAERILRGTQRKDETGAGPDAAPAGAARGAPPPSGFRRVEAGGLLGAPPEKGRSARQADGTYARRTWTWLLVGDREAVRIVYAVRADWSDSPIVAEEFLRARALAESAAPSP